MDGLSKEEYVSTVLSCMDEHRRQQQQQQQRLEQQSQAEQQTQEIMASYLILSIDRRNSVEQAMEVVDLAIRFQTLGVVGIDLCGDPTKGDVSIYRETFLKAKTHGLKITLHFAEVPASSTEEELRTLLSYDPDRIGHVIHVSQAIKDEIVKRKLGLELCLSCNVHAKMITGGGGGFADHHFGWWWRRRRDKGCPIALSVSRLLYYCTSVSESMKMVVTTSLQLIFTNTFCFRYLTDRRRGYFLQPSFERVPARCRAFRPQSTGPLESLQRGCGVDFRGGGREE